VCGAASASLLPLTHLRQAYANSPLAIAVQPGKISIVGPDFPATDVWTFGGSVPGQLIRVRHGETVDATINNGLTVPTSVHWHGIRLPNEMDGVVGLTQPPIEPKASFHYRFTPPDAGTFWYHSHVMAYEQVGRGLYGPLIIDEPDPPQVDRDLIWMIDDWRLADDASIIDNFGAGHDRSHAGRIGNVPTVNGRFRDVVPVRRGERIRLRLINAANARNFALSFDQLAPLVIAVDGQPVTPYSADGPVVIGAAGRVDLVIDMLGEPGSIAAVTDSFYREPIELVKFAYQKSVLRDEPLDADIALPAATIPAPDLSNAAHTEVVIGGGAMGGLRRAMMDDKWMDLREIARQGYVWAINDVVGNKLDMAPLMDLKKGSSVRLTLRNETAFPHPMHLHGHHMQLLSIDDQPLAEPRWVDSPLLMPRQTMELAFVADNPGKWLFHCHVLEHHSAGLGALVVVS
jgi:FtsP/CotA-like multicopper oxidase with cupredoxin domain